MIDELPEEITDEPSADVDGGTPARDLQMSGREEMEEETFSPEQLPPDFEIPPLDSSAEPEKDDGHGATEENEEAEKGDDDEGEDDDAHFLPIDESLLARVNQVFVEPPGYRDTLRELRERFAESNVYIVHGAEHAGKLTCALHLAQTLLDRHGAESLAEKKIYCYRRRPDESPSLLDFVGQESVKRERVYIIEDAFPGFSQEDLAGHFLYLLNQKLLDKGSFGAFLVLTTESPELPTGVALVKAALPDLEQVFRKHLALYASDASAADPISVEPRLLESAGDNWDAFQDELKDPDLIDEFCRCLGLLGGEPKEQDLKDLAHNVALRRIEAARPWFAGLQLHEKLFAFLVVLFPGRDGLSLYEIFLDVLNLLRAGGMSLVDPREIGYHDLLDRIRSTEGPTREIGFHERAIAVEVDWQLRNYHHLLWSLVPRFLEEIRENQGPGRYAGEIRRSRAAAVGRIGFRQPAQLRPYLEELATHPAKSVAAATGHAFSEVCLRDGDADQKVCQMLRAWATSRQWRLKWAASSCLWRVYGAVKGRARDTAKTRARLLDTLEALICELDEGRQSIADQDAWAARREVRKGALYALAKIAAMDPDGIERLACWLADGRRVLRAASVSTIRGLLENAARERLQTRHSTLVALVEPVLTHCGEGSSVTEALFKALASWVDQPTAAEFLAALVKTANRLEGRAARAFRAGLSPWLAHPSPRVRRLGGALLLRSLLLAGEALPAPGSARGALVLDAAATALDDASYEQLARRIWYLLQPRLGLRLARMGDERELAGAGEPFPARIASGDRSRPRLLLPALDALASGELCAVIVLATGPILDLEDVSAAAWSRALLLVDLSAADGAPPVPGAIRIARQSPERGLADLAAALDDRLAQVIAGTPGDVSMGADLETTLAQWTEELDLPQSLDVPGDRAPAIVHAVLALAKSDPDRCSALLSSWLEPSRSELARRLGSGAVRLLLRIEALRAAPPPPLARAHMVRLATALGASSPEGLEVALATIRQWLGTGEWGEALLGRPGAEAGALLEWIDRLPPETTRLVQGVLPDWRRSSGDGPASAAQRRSEAADLIEARIASRAAEPAEGSAADAGPTKAGCPSDAPADRAVGEAEPRPPVIADRAGFPLVWIDAIGAYMHWLPVTKLQFERFIATQAAPGFDDGWYERVLDLNPRAAVAQLAPENYWRALITGVRPEEARQFAAWCGEEYAVPTLEDWRRSYAALATAAAVPGGVSVLLPAAGEPVRALLSAIESSAAAARPASSEERTLADQMLMRRGVLEWVERKGGPASWGGMGEPATGLRTLWSIAKGPVTPRGEGSSRSHVFGFRLIMRPRSTAAAAIGEELPGER
jgi:hypothetical protein